MGCRASAPVRPSRDGSPSRTADSAADLSPSKADADPELPLYDFLPMRKYPHVIVVGSRGQERTRCATRIEEAVLAHGYAAAATRLSGRELGHAELATALREAAVPEALVVVTDVDVQQMRRPDFAAAFRAASTAIVLVLDGAKALQAASLGVCPPVDYTCAVGDDWWGREYVRGTVLTAGRTDAWFNAACDGLADGFLLVDHTRRDAVFRVAV